MVSFFFALLLLTLTALNAGKESEQDAWCTSKLGGGANLNLLQVGFRLAQQEAAHAEAPKAPEMHHSHHRHLTSAHAGDVESWDGAKLLGSDGNNTCAWKDMSSGPKMCCRSYNDTVSDAVKRQGGYGDCPALVSWWTFLEDRRMDGKVDVDVGKAVHGKFYVDVGANIGACLLPMMAQPDVHSALAFEPNPANLFYLSNTLLANPQIKGKVKLYSFALGDYDKTRPIYMEPGNAGNTVVGQAIHTSASAVGKVGTKTLDEVVMKGDTPPYIHLMKMDAQGYEVKILQGASKLFSSGAVNAVKFELATAWLLHQNTSAAEYMNTYMRYGFQIHDSDTKQLVSQKRLHSLACGKSIKLAYTMYYEDFVAVRVREGEVAIQKPIRCV